MSSIMKRGVQFDHLLSSSYNRGRRRLYRITEEIINQLLMAFKVTRDHVQWKLHRNRQLDSPLPIWTMRIKRWLTVHKLELRLWGTVAALHNRCWITVMGMISWYLGIQMVVPEGMFISQHTWWILKLKSSCKNMNINGVKSTNGLGE